MKLWKYLPALLHFAVTGIHGKPRPDRPLDMDLSGTRIEFSANIAEETKAVVNSFLNGGLDDRFGLRWKTADASPAPSKAIIVFELETPGTASDDDGASVDWNSAASAASEGFRFATEIDGMRVKMVISGRTRTALLYGAGHLLRHLWMSKGRLLLLKDADIATSPALAIRGHQLGYRNKANSYDAWNIAEYDRYIRELVVFGTNAIENIPMDDRPENDHMEVSRDSMNVALSTICDRYGIRYWLWTPVTVDISDKRAFDAQLQSHAELYRSTPMISDVFVPGGDPGNNHPRDVLPFLRALDSLLRIHHPDAGVWLSLQKFDEEEVDYFYNYLEQYKPDWIKGVVSGPSSPPTAETRHRLPNQYRHRLYPDITHTVRCEYPPKDLDQAFALTLGREGINPLPYHHAAIHKKYTPFSDGFVSYSDGCHDDVNKVIWSMLGWDPGLPVSEILEQYCRYHFGQRVATHASLGISALENNMRGPLFRNDQVELTFLHWTDLEQRFPALLDNWRWQMLVLRAYYDAYTRRRLLYEQSLEKKAYATLADAEDHHVDVVMEKALDIVRKADSEPVEEAIRQRIVALCDRLFSSIGLQTSVEKHLADNAQRGCILDFVDYPLNNRWWLEDEFKKIQAMPRTEDKLERLEVIRTWEDPGPGSYYDNISNIAQSPHVKSTVYDAVDFAWWDGGYSRARLSSQVFQNQPVLEYENLDPGGRYRIRLAGYGEALIRVDGKRLHPVLYNEDPGSFKEFVVPRTAVGDGKMRVTFDVPEESHLRWTRYSRISDVWLIKK